MITSYHIGRCIYSLACFGVVSVASAQSVFDLAADFSASQNPNGAWSYGWMAPGSAVFHLYTSPVAAYGLNLNEWRGGFPDDNGSAPPDVIRNPTDNPINVNATTWLPFQTRCKFLVTLRLLFGLEWAE